jgi:hypothetical protein
MSACHKLESVNLEGRGLDTLTEAMALDAAPPARVAPCSCCVVSAHCFVVSSASQGLNWFGVALLVSPILGTKMFNLRSRKIKIELFQTWAFADL